MAESASKQWVAWVQSLGWQRQSLTTKLVVAVLCALLPIGLLLGLLWQQRRERDLSTALGSLTQTAESIALIADDVLNDGLKLTQTIATGPVGRSLDPAVFTGRLRVLQQINPGYTNLLIVDAHGVVLGWTGDKPPPAAVLDLGRQDVFGKVIRSREPSLFVLQDTAAPDQVDGGALAPIIGGDGSVIGVVVAVLDLGALGERMHQLPSFSDQGLALIDKDGRIVLVLNASGRQVSELPWEQRQRGGAPEVQAALHGQIVVSRAYQSPVVGDTRIGVWMPIRQHGWVAGVTWPVEAALAPSRAAEQHELLIFISIVLALVIAAAVAARSVVRPLQRLAAHAGRFGSGDFEPIQGVTSNDETGRLASAFNSMGQRLQQTLGDLHAERSHLESVLEQLPVGVVVVSASDSKVVRTNPLGDRYLPRPDDHRDRYDPSDPIGLFHLDGRPYQPHERPLGRVLRDGEPVRGEELLLRAPGEPDVLLNVNAAPIRDREGRIVAAVETFEDVTERRLAEARLHQQDELLRTLIAQFPGALSVVNRDFCFVFTAAGDGFEDRPLRPQLGRTIDEVFPPERIPLVRACLGRAFNGEVVTLEVGADGRIFSAIVCPLRDADGTVSQVLALRFDVTQERETAARLRDREALLQALVEQFPATIIMVDRQYRIVMMGGQRYFTSVAADDLIGRHLTALLADDEFEQYRALADRAFTGEASAFNRIVRGRTLRGTITPLRDASGAIDKVLSVGFDVTDEVARVERAVRDEKLRAMGQMAGGIAHDLNQALTLVSGYGELAREALTASAPNPDSVSEMIRIMERAAYDGGTTVKRLLTFARGGEHEQAQVIDVGVLLHEVEQLTAPRWRDAMRARGSRVTLQVETPPGLSIQGSQGALREMLTNLVFNALDAMPDGGTIVLSALHADGQVVINVADTGTGMPPEVKARVFEPFFTTKGQAGSGLGMAMVFGIVERHHGQIDIATEVGRGTTIRLTFPCAQAPTVPTARPADAVPVQRCRILVVDDEPRLAGLLVGMLRLEGHDGVPAGSAEEALDRLRAESFDLAISDLSMGDGMNGWELAAAIAGSAHPIPVILATGWGAAIDRDEAASRGVSGVIAKPYRRADLRAALLRVLAVQAGDGATASG